MIKRPLIFTSFALIIGVVSGFFMLFAESYVAKALLGLLEHEVVSAGPYKLEYDSADMNFLTLNAQARNVRITEAGKVKVLVPLMKANFSLWKIGKSIATLNELKMVGAQIDGITEQSPLVKVIDYIMTPLPPELASPYTIELQKLILTPSNATQNFGSAVLKAEGLQIAMQRLDGNEFNLTSSVKRINLISKLTGNPVLPLTAVSDFKTTMHIAHDFIDIKKLSAQFEGGQSSGTIHIDNKNGELLSGSIVSRANDRSFGISAGIAGAVEANTSIQGSFEFPKIVSKISGNNLNILSSFFENQLQLSNLDGTLEAADSESGFSAIINNLVGKGENVSVELEEPLRLVNGEISGTIKFHAKSLQSSYGNFSNIVATIKLGQQSGTQLSIEVTTPATFPVKKVISICQIASNKSMSCTITSDDNRLQAESRITFRPSALPFLESANLKYSGDTEFLGDPPEIARRIEISSSISGPLSAELLEANGKISISKLPVLNSISSTLTLKNGLLSILGSDQSKQLDIDISSQLNDKGLTRIKINSRDLALGETKGQDNPNCSTTSFAANLSFPSFDYSQLNGTISVSNFILGCAPYALGLNKAITLSADKGVLSIPNIVLASSSGELKLDGKISIASGYSLSAAGKADLSALLPFAKSLDELSGKLNVDLAVSGPFSKPKLGGKAEITNTRIEIESPQLQVRGARGHAILNDRIVELQDFVGTVNGGTFSVDGALNLDSFAASNLQLTYNKVPVTPIAEAEFVSSGNLSLANLGELQPTITGSIEIESAQIAKRVDLLQLARDTSKKIVGLGSKKIEISAAPQVSPVKLDLKLNAPSSLFFDSNFAQAEAKANLHVSGPAYNPLIEGKVEILEGWFGLRDRRFDIGSGKIIFSPDKTDPDIEILAETSVFSRQGENVVIFASITGSAAAPQIKFDSDRGYTEREIIQLLTTGSDVTSTNRGMGVFSQDFNLDVPFVSDDSLFGLGRWLRRLTKIDSLSIEPSFNSQSGVIEPTLIAEKYIWPNLTLRGETSFGSTGNDARARLNYKIFPRVTVSGIIDALSTQENTALGLDVSYALKPQRSKLLQIILSGNLFLSSDSILTALKLSEDSRIVPESLSRLNESLINYYNDNGFPKATAEFSCGEKLDRGRCRSLNIKVSEKSRLSVNRIETEGDAIPKAILGWLQAQQSSGQTATKLYREYVADGLTVRLRNEGYIRARISSYYKADSNPTSLILSIQLGKPVTFVFSGNEAFSNEELLSTINLFGRRQPFGNNTINLLTTNIERLYSQKGFPYATISWSSPNEKVSERTIYYINIIEGNKLQLSSVKFEGLIKFSERELHSQLEKIAPDSLHAIFNPSGILAESIEENCRIIQATLIYNGFENASVNYRLLQKPDNNRADIIYQVSEGTQNTIESIDVVGMPEGFNYVLPERPYSRKKVQLLKEDILKQLDSAGYKIARVDSIINAVNNTAYINVTSGQPSQIGAIYFEGLEDISQSVIESKLSIKLGQAWNEEEVAKSRQAILRSGLFKKVEIKAKDGVIDSNIEDAVVILEERNLRSIQIGAGVNSEYGLHVFGLITDRSYFADGRSIAARVDTYFDQLKGQVSQGVMSLNYTDPEFLNPEIGYVSDLRFQRLNQTSLEFDLDRVSHSGYLHKNFDENISGSLGHTFLIEKLDDVSPSAVLNPDFDTGTVHIGYLQANALFDYRDNPLNPHNGYAFAVSPQVAGKALGSEANFAGLDIRGTKILPLEGKMERFSLAYSARVASDWAYSGSDYVPISQRYYLGGRTSVRGFRENSLGPKAADGTIIGGDELLTQSAELRYLLIDDATINIFFDSGKLQLRDYSADGEEMRYSVGFGTRYLSPVGPIGFDVGFPLNEKSGEPSARFHFNIGSNF